MNHDVFISYSSKDQKVVEALSHYLEERGIRCFVAYRDIPKGKVWATVITEAIENCQMMVVVFSKDFNISEQVDREIELCAEEKKPILTFRIQDEAFKGAKKYYLKNLNWIDAFPNPNDCFQNLFESIGRLLNIEIRQPNELYAQDDSKTNKNAELITQIETPKIIIRDENENISTDNHSFANFTETVNGVNFDMVAVQGGPFQWKKKTLFLKNIFMGKTPVTISLFNVFVNEIGYKTDAERIGCSYIFNKNIWEMMDGVNYLFDPLGKLRNVNDYNHPVVHISWNDAVAFCIWLSKKINMKFRLPTICEWQFAAGGGATNRTIYAGTNEYTELGKYAWYKNNSKSDQEVAKKLPNKLGLFDMSGNVGEMCYWEKINNRDSEYPSCGGSWEQSYPNCKVNSMCIDDRFMRCGNLGFRLVLVPQSN
jgi:hypothetical protein